MSQRKTDQEKILKIRSEQFPDNVQEVSEKTWETMKAKGLASKFVVVEKSQKMVDTPKEVAETVNSKSKK